MPDKKLILKPNVFEQLYLTILASVVIIALFSLCIVLTDDFELNLILVYILISILAALWLIFLLLVLGRTLIEFNGNGIVKRKKNGKIIFAVDWSSVTDLSYVKLKWYMCAFIPAFDVGMLKINYQTPDKGSRNIRINLFYRDVLKISNLFECFISIL